METKIYTAESVTAGHPDKFCDLISDMVLDECLRQDTESRVACEAFATSGLIVVGGEITTRAELDLTAIVRKAGERVGYDLSNTEIRTAVRKQSPDIDGAVSQEEQGAGDQGIMVGYATDDTLSNMPICYEYARRLTDKLTELCQKAIFGIGSDGKAQVSAEFSGRRFLGFTTILVSVQHDEEKSIEELHEEIMRYCIKPVFAEFDLINTKILINPSGRFVLGGIDADTGLTGRKLVVDAYGPTVRIGGGAYSGKDPSKVDRSAAYMARHIAKTVVQSKAAAECEVELSYAIGKAEPLSVNIDTCGTGRYSDALIKYAVEKLFDLRPKAIIEYLGLKAPIYTPTASGGHYGKDGYPWELFDKADELAKELRLVTIVNGQQEALPNKPT